ncbi:MAG: type VII secretion protein EccB [Kibdelosporangium sp.]
MWTQRDRIQAYQFLRRRLVSAVVSADANHPVPPARRLVLGTAIGAAVALLVAAVFGIIGLLSPARAAEWRQAGQVIVEKETGARLVLGEDGVLHPAVNYASARLFAGGDGTKTITVPAKTLNGVPRGDTVGIPGAPDSVPARERLLAGPWTSCTHGSSDRPANVEPPAKVLLGQSVAGRALEPGQGFLVRTKSGDRFLVTGGNRYRVVDGRAVTALGYGLADPVLVAANWLNTIPAGPDLKVLSVPGNGRGGPAVAGRSTTVGQLFRAGGEYYLVTVDGLAAITETEALLIGGRATEVTPAAIDRVQGRSDGGYPRRRPDAVPVGQGESICLTGEQIVFATGLPDAGVVVPGGAGAVATEQPGGTTYLITDTGRKHPVADEDAVKALGYGGVPRQPLPAAVLALFPGGAPLDTAQARRTITLG